MSSKHSLFVAAICALPLSIAACGGGGTENQNIVPTGMHYGYVVSKAQVPTMPNDVTAFALDLGSKTSSKPDGLPDNALGAVFSALTMLKFDIQGTINTAVDQGNILLLVDFQTKDFTNADASGLTVKLGANAMPLPCNGSADTTCRHHLDGTGTFTIATDSPMDEGVTGKIAGGTFTTGANAGDLTLQIAVGSTTPIKLALLHARATATSISAAGMTAILGGLVTTTELTTQIGPPLLSSVKAVVARDCTGTGTGCGCADGSTGALVLSVVDFNPKDCMVTVDELFTNPVVKPMLTPDSCSQDSCTAADSLSIGVKVQAVKGTFPLGM
jgi:hypothetical protein